ncbi:MAG: hypothetical protein AAF909_07705 [Pseudomonadota bacterium]
MRMTPAPQAIRRAPSGRWSTVIAGFILGALLHPGSPLSTAALASETDAESAAERVAEPAAAAEAPAEKLDFSEGSAANTGWPLLPDQEKARFTATVVDVLCELMGDCPEDCGAGRRQLGLLRSADGVLVLPVKNVQPIFTGAVIDLIGYCGQTVEVDGVMLILEDAPKPFYFVQRIKGEDDEAFRPTNQFSQHWIANNQEVLSKPGRWFNKDPRITSRIEAEGRLGLGPEADAAYIEEWF